MRATWTSVPADLSSLNLVRVDDALTPETFAELAERLLEPFAPALRSVRVHEYALPEVERIDASLLANALHQSIGGHVLGITRADLIDQSGEDFFSFVFGGATPASHAAVVSSRRLRAADPQVSFERVLKVALHEVGHSFGLVHHYSFERASESGCCPMSKGEFNRYGEHGYVRSVIDGRGFRFCAACAEFLRRFWATRC
jgi:hypothetical protein